MILTMHRSIWRLIIVFLVALAAMFVAVWLSPNVKANEVPQEPDIATMESWYVLATGQVAISYYTAANQCVEWAHQAQLMPSKQDARPVEDPRKFLLTAVNYDYYVSKEASFWRYCGGQWKQAIDKTWELNRRCCYEQSKP